jgi:hypothetical protein
MAKLSVHGEEIGRLHYSTFSEAYFIDGKVLRNDGSGWKLRGKMKEGFDIREHFAKNQKKQNDFLAKFPATAKYRKMLRDLGGSKRWKLHTAIEIMPDDPDGVWSETCDGYGDNCSASIEEVCKLCELYQLAISERQEAKAQA